MRGNYLSFAETVATVLKAAIYADPSLRLQQVQHRAKDPVSLKKKLEEAEVIDSKNIENFAKDLAGCRLVFYTNSDVNLFLSSGILRDNFVIVWERTKFHHPSPDTNNAAELFISNNYVVRLNDQRVSLPEYAGFRDMCCEVQVQTTLNHAWSEMEHDMLYKKPKLEGFGGSLMQAIDKRMKTIMRDFLLPAGYEFQKVVNDFERLSLGKELFDQGALKALSDCDDNNARHALLERFATYVLPHYDDLQSIHAEIRSVVVSAVKEARKTPTRTIETPFGSLPGHTVEDILDIATDILNQLRYLGVEAVEATFDAICELYADATSDTERQCLLKSANNLSKHELNVWKEAGPLVQQLLIERIRSLNTETLVLCKPVVMEVLGQVLQPKVEGTSSTYDTLTIHTGAVTSSEMLSSIRSSAIELLENLFRHTILDAERRAIKQLLEIATRTPYRGNYSNALLKTVLENTTNIVEFYIEVAGEQSYELLQEIEHDLLWLYRRNRDMPGEITADPEIATARERLTKYIFAFRDLINLNRGFSIYKTLVGYQSVFPPAWEDDEFEVEGQDAYRTQKIGELVDEVTEENADEWLTLLSRCAQTESNDMATFPSFGQFLEKLGSSKPQILMTYLDRLNVRLANFLPAMLTGLESGGMKNAVREKVGHWVNRRQYLRQLSRYQRFAYKFDADLLEQSVKAAIEVDDNIAVVNALDTSIAHHGDVDGGLIDKVFLPALKHLSRKGDTRWVSYIWPLATKNQMFQDLKPEQADIVLTSLVRHPQIEYRVEDLLASIATHWPEKVADFFGSRLQFEQTPECYNRYEAIPFELNKLRAPLGSIPDYLVENARFWFDEDKPLFTYRGGRLLSTVFPEFTQDFEDSLTNRLLNSHDRTDIEFIVSVLQNYEGKIFTHNLCKNIVELLPIDDPLLDEIEMVLNSTGVVRGEFGFAEAYRRKKTEIDPWLEDSRENIQSFARRYLLLLDRHIAAEQRKSEEQLELRKRNYGEVDNSNEQLDK